MRFWILFPATGPRTNLLRKPEQKTIAFLVQRIPSWISSNMLTAIGFFGNIIVFLSFILATYLHRNYPFTGHNRIHGKLVW